MGSRERARYVTKSQQNLNRTKGLIIATLDGLTARELGKILSFAAGVRLNCKRKVAIGYTDLELAAAASEAMNQRLEL